jgi:hypothetical protein
MVKFLFDQELLDFLSGAIYDPNAERCYEAMSDSFFWSDELDWEALAKFGTARPFREFMGYRGSVIRGAPDFDLQPLWEQVSKACPNWPGLRPERNSASLAGELRKAGRRFCVEALRLEREFRRQEARGE